MSLTPKQQQQLDLSDSNGPSVWQSAQEYKDKLPDDAWEAQMRKALNDAAWQNLAYLPYCSHIPCCRPKCEQPTYAWDDQHMAHGHLLLSTHQSSVALERLLSVAKLCLVLLSDMVRRSDDTQDTPILILGHHYISQRKLGEGSPPASGSSSGPSTVPPAAAGAAGGTTYAAYLQEICTFDNQEGPKTFVGAEGVPLAQLDLQVEPIAIARSKRMGRDLTIKVELNGGGSLQLLEKGEKYVIGSWPAMLLLTPTSPRCPITFKGELAISCPTNNFLLTLNFDKDCSVKGTIEQLQDAPPTLAAAAAAAAGSAAAAAAAAEGKTQVLGSLSGKWTSVVDVSCPTLGLEGVLYDSSSVRPPPVLSVDLAHLGPMRMSRLWSAIHDSVLYADPRLASGGRAAAKLATTMSQYLKALTLDNAYSRDVPGTAAAAAGGGAGGLANAAERRSSLVATGRSITSSAVSTAALSSAGSDADIEEFDRALEGRGVADTEDKRAVPPCYKAEHAAGNKLRYQLHYTVHSLPAVAAA